MMKKSAVVFALFLMNSSFSYGMPNDCRDLFVRENSEAPSIVPLYENSAERLSQVISGQSEGVLRRHKISVSLRGQKIVLNFKNKWNWGFDVSDPVIGIDALDFGGVGPIQKGRRLLLSITTHSQVNSYEIDLSKRVAKELNNYELPSEDLVLLTKNSVRSRFTMPWVGRIWAEVEPYQYVLSERSLAFFKWVDHSLQTSFRIRFHQPVVDYRVIEQSDAREGREQNPLMLVAHERSVQAYEITPSGIRVGDSILFGPNIGTIGKLFLIKVQNLSSIDSSFELAQGVLVICRDRIRLFKLDSTGFTFMDEIRFSEGISHVRLEYKIVSELDGLAYRRIPIMTVQTWTGTSRVLDMSQSQIKDL